MGKKVLSRILLIIGIVILAFGVLGAILTAADGDVGSAAIGGGFLIIVGIVLILIARRVAKHKKTIPNDIVEKNNAADKEAAEQNSNVESSSNDREARKQRKQELSQIKKTEKEEIKNRKKQEKEDRIKAKKAAEEEKRLALQAAEEERLRKIHDFKPTKEYAINPQGVFLKNGEMCFYEGNVQGVEEKTVTTGYSGGTAGVSFRVAKGVSVRTGGVKGHANKEQVQIKTPGMIYITNQRIIHTSNKSPFDKKLTQISNIQFYSDGFHIQIGQKNYVFLSDEVERIAVVLDGIANGQG